MNSPLDNFKRSKRNVQLHRGLVKKVRNSEEHTKFPGHASKEKRKRRESDRKDDFTAWQKRREVECERIEE